MVFLKSAGPETGIPLGVAYRGILNTIYICPHVMSSVVEDPLGFGSLGKAIISLFLVPYHHPHQCIGSLTKLANYLIADGLLV